MKRIISIVLLALTFTAASASVIDEADQAYGNDDFIGAVKLYKQAIDELGPSAERYYNLGNAYYRADSIGMAIVSYERALRLDPTNNDLIDNLEFVNSKTTDRLQLTKSFVGNTADKISGTLHPNTLAWLALAAFVLALAGVATYFFASSVGVRKISFFGAGALIVICVVLNILAYRNAQKVNADDQAVIISRSVILSTTPRTPKDRSEEAMLLHEGTKVTVLDSINTGTEKWYDVKVDDNNRAWIPANEVVRI